MSWLRAVSNRLTYANVVATLALFVALGGASYASLVLPTGSVGRAQLRVGAVTPTALGFPLGAQSFNGTSPIDFPRGECNGGTPVPAGQPPPPCAPSRIAGPSLGNVTLGNSGELVVSGVVDVRNEAAPGTSATVRLGALIEPQSERQRILDPSSIVLEGGQEEQVPVQGLVTLHAGHHAIGLGARVSNRPGGVRRV